MTQESIFLLHALRIGALITLVYDGVVIIRKTLPHNSFWTALEDIGFWLFCAIYVFSCLYRESNGTLRWYAVAGALLGMWIYRKLLSVPFVKAGSFILGKVIMVLCRVCAVLTVPLRHVWRKMAGLHNKARRHRKKLLGKCKFKLKSFVKTLKIRLCKQ